MRAAEPVLTQHLFTPLNRELIAMLRSLSSEEWLAPTVAGAWTVKDVAAHLLDTALRRLSLHRDGHARDVPPGTSLGDLVRNLNAEGVAFGQRLSTRVLTDLLAWAGDEQAAFFATLDPFAQALWGVSWAGEAQSANWLDIARELTERWHHQQQIRDATHRPPLYDTYLAPVIATFVRALPYGLRDVDAPRGTAVVFASTDAFSVVRDDERWTLYDGAAPNAATTITMPGDVAWRLFTKGLTPSAARARSHVEGDTRYADAIFATIAIIG
jgi:uncharacterized protein (TIGR03083 family)